MSRSFLSPAPDVRLVRRFERGLDDAMAAARTCYSGKGIVWPEEVAGDGETEAVAAQMRARRDRLATDIYGAGHHTTFQHVHFQFALANVSRQFLWSFLHSHPFYNSEQVSQRYVAVKPGNFAIPPLEGQALSIYRATAERMNADYAELGERLAPVAAAAFFERFPARRHQPERWAREIRRKAQEAARYLLPVATFAYLHHTISAITLFRYRRLCEIHDAPLEQRLVVDAMIAAVLAVDPDLAHVLEEPLPLETTLEFTAFQALARVGPAPGFRVRFDAQLGGRSARLVDWSRAAEETVAESVREVLGASASELGDDQALLLLLDPERNRYLGEALNLGTHSKLARCLSHAHYTFRKKLSHTADSQDQRHRMTPASRPILAAQVDAEPDVVAPALVERDEACRRFFAESCARAWEGMAGLVRRGVAPELAHYLLPNAVAIRFTESADLLNLHHKHTMRLCLNAQEEIWRASMDEAAEVRAVHPRIGRWLLPPCSQRARAGAKPPCPEGGRYCGVPVWKLDLADLARDI